jgi:hypothetical protein
MDEDDDLKDLDPDDIDSIVRWSRKQRLRGRSYEQEEPKPQAKPKQTDTDAAAISKSWVDYIDGVVHRALNRFWENMEEEVVKNFATRDDLDNLRKEMHREVSRASNKLIIFDAGDPRAKKHLDADRDKILDWNAARKRG